MGASLGIMTIFLVLNAPTPTLSHLDPKQSDDHSGTQDSTQNSSQTAAASTRNTTQNATTLFKNATLVENVTLKCEDLLCQYKADKCDKRGKQAEEVAKETSCKFAVFWKNSEKHMRTRSQFLLYSEPVKWCIKSAGPSADECFARKHVEGCKSDEKELKNSESIQAYPCSLPYQYLKGKTVNELGTCGWSTSTGQQVSESYVESAETTFPTITKSLKDGCSGFWVPSQGIVAVSNAAGNAKSNTSGNLTGNFTGNLTGTN